MFKRSYEEDPEVLSEDNVQEYQGLKLHDLVIYHGRLATIIRIDKLSGIYIKYNDDSKINQILDHLELRLAKPVEKILYGKKL